MNSKFCIPLIALCAILSLKSFAEISQEAACTTITTHSDSSLGQKWIKELISAYNAGKFDSRMTEINSEVQKALKEGKLDQVKASIKEWKESVNSHEAKKEMKDIAAQGKSYREKLSQLNQECIEALTNVSNIYPNSEIVKSIKQFILFSNTYINACNSVCFIEKYPSLYQLENMLDRKNKTFNLQFTEIANEYHLKYYTISFIQKRDFEMIEGAVIGFETESYENQHEIDSILIRYEKYLNALKIAQAQANASLVSLISQAINEYIEVFGIRHDLRHLNLLGKRSVSPQDEAEKQVAEIMSNYQASQKTLIQKYFQMPIE